MLNVLADTHHFSGGCKLLLDYLEGGDGAGFVAFAEEVECKEACEVLEGSQRLITAGCWVGQYGFTSVVGGGVFVGYQSMRRSGCSARRWGGRQGSRRPF